MEVEVQAIERSTSGQSQNVNAAAPLAGVSLAGGFYMLVLLAAAIMRFTALGRIPLAPTEAAEALAAWRFLQPGSLPMDPGSPAYFSLTSLLMSLFGVSDGVARFVPALFGLGLVALPWLLHRQLGRLSVLIAAALLAASPLNSVVSRTAGGDAIALFAVLLFAISLFKLHLESEDTRWIFALAVSLGLGLCSSPLFYSGLLALLLAWFITRSIAGEPYWGAWPPGAAFRNAVIAGLLLFIGLSTRFFTYPAGLGDAAQLFGTWLGQFGFAGGVSGTLAPFLLLGRYEAILVLLGGVAFVWAYWRSTTARIWLTFWLLTTFVVMLLQSTTPVNVLLATLPAYLLIGHFSGYLVGKHAGRWTWLLTAGLLLVGAILLVNTTRYLRISVYEQDLSNLWLMAIALGAAALMLYYFWSMTDAAPGAAIWSAVLLLLLAYQWGTAWHLTHFAANDPRESWVIEGTDDDIPVMLEMLTDIAREVTNSDNELQLLSAVDTPVFAWYLRDFPLATLGQAVPPQATQQVIISSAASAEPQFGADYVGTDFGLLRAGATMPLESTAPVSDLLRWWLFHETSSNMIEERVILWVRADLVQPES
ncbi:MAG: glycosyltransferase family 39 protein [Candidatus Promineifilaceae bacterium]